MTSEVWYITRRPTFVHFGPGRPGCRRQYLSVSIGTPDSRDASRASIIRGVVTAGNLPHGWSGGYGWGGGCQGARVRRAVYSVVRGRAPNSVGGGQCAGRHREGAGRGR